MDMQYGLAKGESVLISNIARNLDENIKLNYTIDRLCDNLVNLYQDEKEMIWNNYLNEVSKNIDKENAVVLFDDSDINKEYSKKLEDLDDFAKNNYEELSKLKDKRENLWKSYCKAKTKKRTQILAEINDIQPKIKELYNYYKYRKTITKRAEGI